MIVVDTSVFIDLLFEYDSERTHSSEELFSTQEENALTITEPDLFKVELTGKSPEESRKKRLQTSAMRYFLS